MVLATAGALELLPAGREQLAAAKVRAASAKVRAAAAVGVVMRMAECVVSEEPLVAMNGARAASVRAAAVVGVAMMMARCGAEAVQGELEALLEDTAELEDSTVGILVLAEALDRAV